MQSRLMLCAVCCLGAWAGVSRAQHTAEGGPPAESRVSRPEDDALRRLLMEGARGSLAIQVVQGTQGGPAVDAGEVQVDLYHTDHSIWEFRTALEPGGMALVGDLPVAVAVRALVRIEYGGVTYLEIGPPMGPESPDAVVKLTVYETTTEEPAWRIASRHLMVGRGVGGAEVHESLVVENPTDRTWLGGEPDTTDQRTAVRVHLPPGARDVTLEQGFHGWCCTKFGAGELAVQMPLMPGQTTFQYSYLMPEAEKRLDVRFGAPVATDHVLVFVPDDGTQAEAAGVTLAGSEVLDGGRMRVFQGASLGAGSEASVVLTSVRTPVSGGGAQRRGVGRSLVIAGGVALVLGVGALVVARMRRA